MKRWKVILFDLDGTLIDHFRAIHRAYQHAQKELGLPVASLEKVKHTVGGSVPVTMRKLIGEEVEDLSESLRLFDEYFSQIMLEDVDVLPGVFWLIQKLYRRGQRMGVFTNKNGEHARAVLEHLDLARYFEVIAGAGDTPFRKPQVEFSKWILERLQCSSDEVLLVGDSPFDVEAGHTVQMKVVAVASGSHDADQLAASGADWVVANFFDLGKELFGESPLIEGNNLSPHGEHKE